MAQRNDMAEKKRVLIDGEELPGLVSLDTVALEKARIEVPEFSRIRTIQNGIIKVPEVTGVYKISRDSNTLKFLRDWFFNDETHDVVVLRTDASGTVFAQTLLPDTEMAKYEEPPYDGASPTYAQLPFIWAPWDVIPIDV